MKKMTRMILIFSLVIVLGAATSSAAFAGKGGNPKGTITEIAEDDTWFTLATEDGPVTVFLPEGFVIESIAVDMYVVVRGDWDGEDVIYAITVRATTPEAEAEEADDDDDDDGEGRGTFQNAFCTGQKDRAHPMAVGLGETYGADVGMVMTMFCNGFSIGEIMLALQTQQMTGTPPEQSLGLRQNGQGWGQIWQDAGLIGSAKHGTPPGQVDKPLNPGHGGTPPGQGEDPPGNSNRNEPDTGDDDD